MIKLALIGKDIQHSRSLEIYKRLVLIDEIQYDLLDYENSSLIPSVSDLFKIYDGISITSPYKKHFINQVQLTNKAKALGAINCLAKKAGNYSGENTDYLAIVDILQKFKRNHQCLNVVILGDGVMSQVAQIALRELGLEFKVLTRKITNDLDQLNTLKIFSDQFKAPGQALILNTCSREFIFKGDIDNNTIFWDFNYNFTPHSDFFSSKTNLYLDGMEMLELQAVHALSFWSINHR